ncbi:carbon-nitrogen hydrolase family protein [Myxococcus sp. K15C18031901]|uniref:carbon-nitrogen hydrolase family protein n=1 Tax=Myxococcus dinghuensis TaxID=2906761 RepID=UPI0020A7A812|nr:carbon-nitrogen hydrolase family protein [Myxococcus dinghuensis]MCP3101919.1 carbon-nitrogen hydrolase family protein [Myxococcus dinghuensis]
MDTASHVELYALQPQVSLEDYASPAAFSARHRALAARVDALRERDAAGRPRHPALVVWPEWVGTALAFLGQVSRVRGQPTLRSAMKRVAWAEAFPLWRTWRELRPPGWLEGLHVLLAPRTHRVMWETFSAIARDFDLWVVAGSALLPANRRGQDTPDFEPYGTRTYNTGYTFAPSGHCVAVTRKVNLVPTREDVLHLSPGRPEDLALVPTPFGRLGTVLCYDAFRAPHTSEEPWFVPCAQYLDSLGADVLAQPSSNVWPWEATAPVDTRGGARSRGEQWHAEGLASQLPALRHVRYAVNAQLAGGYLDQRFGAPSLILGRTSSGEARVLARSEHPREEDVLHVTVPVGD